MIPKTLHRELKIEQHKPHKNWCSLKLSKKRKLMAIVLSAFASIVLFLNSRHQERSNRRKANKFKVLGAIKPKGLNRIAKKGLRAHMSEGVEP